MRRLPLDTMGPLRAEAEKRVNRHFNNLAGANLQQDHEHARKRVLAEGLLSGKASAALSQEASLTGVDQHDLARIILEKEDEVMIRGLERRRALIAIRAAMSPGDIDEVLAGFGLDAITKQREI